jgi:putative isomerase
MVRELVGLAMGVALCLVGAGQIDGQEDMRVLRTAEYRALQKKLSQGWNTWSANSVLAHVHLPDAFALTLGLKSAGLGPMYQNAFFQANETAGRPEKIRLGPHADDGSFTELTLEWKTATFRPDANNVLLVQSATENSQQYILITVKKRDSLRPMHLIVEAGFYWNRPGTVRRDGQLLRARSEAAGAPTYEVRATAPDIKDPFVTANTPYLSLVLDGQIAVYTGPEKHLDAVKTIIDSRRAEHVARLAARAQAGEAFTAMQTILGWNLTYDPENDRAISPVSRLWSATWGGYVLFDWDTYFAAFMYSLYNKELAFANAVEITKGITRRGFIPNFHSAYQLKSEDRSQPPVGSLMVREIYKRHKERWFLQEVYDELLRWNRWWPTERDCGGLLCWGSDPVRQTLDGQVNNFTAALDESGLDNSPMYDRVPFNQKTHMLEIADVGLTSLYVADCDALSEIATILGEVADVQELRARRVKYAKALQTLWDKKTGMYLNRRTDTGEFSPKLSPTNFYPLIAKVPTQQQAERMQAHYFNPEEFHGEWVIPSIARDVPGFKDQQYWRGRIWGPMNFLVYLGLRNYDLPAARVDLAERSSRLLMRSWVSERAVYENYNAIAGSGNDVRSSDAYYHWGALLGVLPLLEEGL